MSIPLAERRDRLEGLAGARVEQDLRLAVDRERLADRLVERAGGHLEDVAQRDGLCPRGRGGGKGNDAPSKGGGEDKAAQGFGVLCQGW